MVDTGLAQTSNQLMLGTVVLYVIAMVGYAADLAFGQRPAAPAGPAAERQRTLAGAGGPQAPDVAGPRTPAASPSGSAAADGRRELDWGRFAVMITVFGWVAHLAGIITRGMAASRWPWGNMYEFVTAIAFAAVTAHLVLLARQRVRFLGAFVMFFVIIGLGIATIWLYTEAGPLVPALKSYWIAIHVTAAIAATGTFTVAAAGAALYLITARREATPAGSDRQGVVAGLVARLPGAEIFDRISHRTVMFGFPIWTFAVVAGAIWADEAWGRYWGWDPKETWSFITWVVYAGYLHAQATAGWKGRRAAVISLVAFATLLFNLFGVNIWISGLHSYAGV